MLTKILYDKIEDNFKDKIIKIDSLTTDVNLLYMTNQKLIVKEVNQKVLDIYHYLVSENIEGIRLPTKKLSDGQKVYLVFPYVKTINYPDGKQIIDLINVINNLHHKTAFTVKLEHKYFKFFYRVYQKLDRTFQTLEMWVREVEVKENKDDFDWIILSKYHIFLKAKQIMYPLQKRIHKYLDNKGEAIFCLNHGNPALNHFINHQLISFNNSYLGIFVSDLAKLYVSLDHFPNESFRLLDEVLESYQNRFYKLYFKFLVLYIYMMTLNFDFSKINYNVEIYVQVANRVQTFLKLTANYE